jgi:hypothetical protein
LKWQLRLDEGLHDIRHGAAGESEHVVCGGRCSTTIENVTRASLRQLEKPGVSILVMRQVPEVSALLRPDVGDLLE